MRVLVFVVVLLATSITAAAQPFDSRALAQDKLPPYHQLGRDVLREVIETKTPTSVGITALSEKIAARFRAASFAAADVHVIGPTDRNKNVVVRYRGTGKQKPILLLGHLDVVEARREDWSFDPFVLTEKDGYFQ